MTRIRLGDGVGEGSWIFHSRFPRSVNFYDGADLVSVVPPETGAGPHAVVMERLPGGETPRLTVGGGRLEIADRRYSFTAGDVYHSRPVWGVPEASRLAAGIGSLKAFMRRHAPDGSLARWMDGAPRKAMVSAFDRELMVRLIEGKALLLGDDPAAGARLLHGAGRGLTPAGDDFIAGMLHGWRLRESWWGIPRAARIDAVYAECRAAGNPFVATFLREARDGRVFERLEHVVRALLDGSSGAVEIAAARLFAVGATSGADLAAGLVTALENGNKD